MLKFKLSLIAGLAVLGLSVGAANAAAAPEVNTQGVKDVKPTAATLTGVVDPNGAATKYFFEYGPGLSRKSRTRNAGDGSNPVNVATRISNLQPGTQYAYRLVAVNSAGTARGDTETFQTPRKGSNAPSVATGAARDVAQAGATLTGAINTRGQTGAYTFQYGPTRQYGAQTPATPFGPTSKATAISSPVGGLSAATRYHYRLVFTPTTGSAVYGRDRTFTTQREPNGLLIRATPNPVRYGRGIQVAGVLAGTGNSGVPVAVQVDTFPFEGNWRRIAGGRTDATGAYVIPVSPMLVNSQVRTVADTRPSTISQPETVGVRLAVSLHVSTKRPRRGHRVRFHGRVRPSQDGALVRIQRRVRGHYRTIARTTVRGSSYSRRVKISHRGRYRALVRPTDGSHVSGKRSRFLRVR